MAVGMSIGFYGKIPVRGDFVQAGLPRGFVLAWDGWVQKMLSASRIELGGSWLDAWLEAPVWRFRLPARACGPDPVLGLWMPSVDLAGRHFPLTFAAVGPVAEAGDDTAWLDAAEDIGLAALESDLAPDVITQRLRLIDPPSAHPPPAGLTTWWTAGAPGVAACTRQFSGMPGVADVGSLLLDTAMPPEDP